MTELDELHLLEVDEREELLERLTVLLGVGWLVLVTRDAAAACRGMLRRRLVQCDRVLVILLLEHVTVVMAVLRHALAQVRLLQADSHVLRITALLQFDLLEHGLLLHRQLHHHRTTALIPCAAFRNRRVASLVSTLEVLQGLRLV